MNSPFLWVVRAPADDTDGAREGTGAGGSEHARTNQPLRWTVPMTEQGAAAQEEGRHKAS